MASDRHSTSEACEIYRRGGKSSNFGEEGRNVSQESQHHLLYSKKTKRLSCGGKSNSEEAAPSAESQSFMRPNEETHAGLEAVLKREGHVARRLLLARHEGLFSVTKGTAGLGL